MPGKKSRYCWEHEVNNAGRLKFQSIFLLLKGEESPCHLAAELSAETVKRLTGTQAKEFAKVKYVKISAVPMFARLSLSSYLIKKYLMVNVCVFSQVNVVLNSL